MLIQVNLKHTIMKAKKSVGADLRNKSTLFLEIGMVIALAAVFAAFQWSTEAKNNFIFAGGETEFISMELPPITRPEPPKLPEPPKPEIKKELVIVENTVDTKDPVPVFTDDSNTPVVIIPMPDELPVVEPEIIYIAEKMPSFKGGMAALNKYLRKELQYPEEASINNVQGRVFVEFVVNKKGEIERARIIKGIDPLLDKEALRVVNNMPNWEPGMQNQKTVSVYFTIPINFKLN